MAFDAIDNLCHANLMKAELLFRYRTVFEEGYFLRVIVWKTPENVPPSTHGLKYSLFYGRPGERIVAYDNERGKGDHRHYRSTELPYEFTSLAKMLQDFEMDVKNERGDTQ